MSGSEDYKTEFSAGVFKKELLEEPWKGFKWLKCIQCGDAFQVTYEELLFQASITDYRFCNEDCESRSRKIDEADARYHEKIDRMMEKK